MSDTKPAVLSAAETLTSSFEDLQALGLYTGMGDIYIALMLKEDTPTEPPEYAKPILAAEGISFGITPEYAEGSQSASDRTLRKVRIPSGYTVRLEYPRILAAVRAYLLGHARDAKGGEICGDATPPYVAVGYAAHRDDGTSHMRWLYKVRFSEQTVDDATAEEGTIAYKIPVLEGQAVKTNCTVALADSKKIRPLRYDADTAEAGCGYTEESFFAAVPWYSAAAA